MEIKMDELWKVTPGTIVNTEDKIGIYLGREEWGHVIWNGYSEEVIEEWDDDDIVNLMNGSKVGYGELVDIQAKKVLNLANEGWTLDKDNQYLNINGELDKLKVYKEVCEIVGDK